MLANVTATLDEVAAALGQKPEWLRRNWLRLHQNEGFPRRLSTGWVWPRRSVELWLGRGGQPAPMPANENEPDPEADPVAAARAELMKRYGGRA